MVEGLERFIRERAEDAQLVEHVGDEVVFTVPLTMSAERLQILFSDLDRSLATLGIDTYGVSAPSLQQVTKKLARSSTKLQIFLRVAPMSEQKLKKAHGRCSCMRGLFQRRHKLAVDNVNLLAAADGSAVVGQLDLLENP
jgi:hypothetical protein